MTLRVGIIGCGGIAGMHMKGYRACEGVEVVACADKMEDRARGFAQNNEIGASYGDWKTMLARENLDAVSVCTPNYAHCEPTVQALKRNVHVLCEKPIAMNAKEARRMVDAAHASKAMLTIGHHNRFHAYSLFARKMVAEGELGEVYYGRSEALRRRGIPGWGEFHIKEKSGGGPMIDIGVHALDLILWVMGSPEPVSVSGSAYTKFGNRRDFHSSWGEYRREDYDVEDFACGIVKFSNGASLLLEASWAAHLPFNDSHEQRVLGDKGGLSLNLSPPPGVPNVRMFKTRGESLLDVLSQGFPAVEPHVEEVKYWISCIRGENAVLVKPEECLNVQRIIDSVYESSEKGREIVLKSTGPAVKSKGGPRGKK